MKITRFATPGDFELISNYLQENPFDLGKEILFSDDEKQIYLKTILDSRLDDNSKFLYKVIIQTENSTINGLIYMMMFKFINQYFLYGLKTSIQQNFYKIKNTVIEDLYNYAITYAENIGYYSYYAIAVESTDERKTRIAYKDLEKLKRYEKYTVGYIESNKLPYYDIIKLVKIKKSKSKVMVRNFMLKEEFRSNPNLSVLPKF